MAPPSVERANQTRVLHVELTLEPGTLLQAVITGGPDLKPIEGASVQLTQSDDGSYYKLPKEQQSRARRLGIGAALIMRLALLATISIIVQLTAPLRHRGGASPENSPFLAGVVDRQGAGDLRGQAAAVDDFVLTEIDQRIRRPFGAQTAPNGASSSPSWNKRWSSLPSIPTSRRLSTSAFSSTRTPLAYDPRA